MANARHPSNIRAPPSPSPQMYVKCGNLCGQRGRKRFIASWGLRMSHTCPCTPSPAPKGIGQMSKVVILPTTAHQPLVRDLRDTVDLLPTSLFSSSLSAPLHLVASVNGQLNSASALYWMPSDLSLILGPRALPQSFVELPISYVYM